MKHSLLLSALLIFSICFLSGCADPAASVTSETEITTEPQPEGEAATAAEPQTSTISSEEIPMQIIGTAEEITKEQIRIDGGDSSSPYDDTILNITEETLFLSWSAPAQDSALKEKRPEEIQPGDSLYAYVSPNMTRSIPPMTNAYLILCDVGLDGSAPAYGQITEITTDDSGNLNFYLDCDLVLIPNPQTRICRLAESLESAEAASDLKVGDRVLVRYTFMTMSLPAMTNPDAIWILE